MHARCLDLNTLPLTQWHTLAAAGNPGCSPPSRAQCNTTRSPLRTASITLDPALAPALLPPVPRHPAYRPKYPQLGNLTHVLVHSGRVNCPLCGRYLSVSVTSANPNNTVSRTQYILKREHQSSRQPPPPPPANQKHSPTERCPPAPPVTVCPVLSLPLRVVVTPWLPAAAAAAAPHTPAPRQLQLVVSTVAPLDWLHLYCLAVCPVPHWNALHGSVELYGCQGSPPSRCHRTLPLVLCRLGHGRDLPPLLLLLTLP